MCDLFDGTIKIRRDTFYREFIKCGKTELQN